MIDIVLITYTRYDRSRRLRVTPARRT